MGEVWSKERAWAWYDDHNWLRGCNFMSSDCANRIDQWQEEGFEERLKTADEELALAAETGYNTIRIMCGKSSTTASWSALTAIWRLRGSTASPAWWCWATTVCSLRNLPSP